MKDKQLVLTLGGLMILFAVISVTATLQLLKSNQAIIDGRRQAREEITTVISLAQKLDEDEIKEGHLLAATMAFNEGRTNYIFTNSVERVFELRKVPGFNALVMRIESQ